MDIARVPIDQLKPHPRNYRQHPDDQLEHIIFSIKTYGFYRSIIACKDGTILAGHGLVEAAKKIKVETVPVVFLDLDQNDPRALKILIGDNEIAKMGEIDDRKLTDMLKEIRDSDFEFQVPEIGFDVTKLHGTGFDDKMLAALVMVTRPESEIRDMNEAAEWVGMPEYEPGKKPIRIIVSLDDDEARVKFMELIGVKNVHKRVGDTYCINWPDRPKEDLASVKFKEEDGKTPS